MNAPTTLAPEDQRHAAKVLYWQGWRVSAIAEHLDVPRTTVASWKERDQWEETKPSDRVELALEARLVQLITKEKKTGLDFKEIDLLNRQRERNAKIHRFEQTGNQADLNPNLSKRTRPGRRQPVRNEVSEEAKDLIIEAFNDSIFDYQKAWQAAGLAHRIRNLLKSRQIGATWYFAFEAFVDALETGRNQIFLSASKAQAHVFRQYIVQFAKEGGVELTGDPIVLPNGAHLYFLGTNARTAQSYHGNVYMDEYFWIHRFKDFRKVAAGMAMHKKWRLTYISTPSSVTHEAYGFWTGDHFNKGRPKDQRIKIDVSHKALAQGRLCEDGQWRQIVNVEDAVAGGCDLFDLAQLRLEYNEEEFNNLLMCMFIDDSQSVFSLYALLACMVDSWEVWTDLKPYSTRPLGNQEVWLGYDPSKNRDPSSLVAVAPPAVEAGPLRVIDKISFKGMDFQGQADVIKAWTQKYRVTRITIDTTGLGEGVYQIVKTFFPTVRALHYSPEIKNRLVLKALDVVGKRRLQFDSGWTDMAASFMAIKKTMTESQRQVTYTADRSEETGHADLAWATMHAIDNEPIAVGQQGNRSSILEFYS